MTVGLVQGHITNEDETVKLILHSNSITKERSARSKVKPCRFTNVIWTVTNTNDAYNAMQNIQQIDVMSVHYYKCKKQREKKLYRSECNKLLNATMRRRTKGKMTWSLNPFKLQINIKTRCSFFFPFVPSSIYSFCPLGFLFCSFFLLFFLSLLHSCFLEKKFYSKLWVGWLKAGCFIDLGVFTINPLHIVVAKIDLFCFVIYTKTVAKHFPFTGVVICF